MADAKVPVEKLNDENYVVWKFKMELLLYKEDLLDTVMEAKPEAAGAAWLKKDGHARVMIGLAVENDQLVHICRKTTSKEMWDTLAGIHGESNYANTLHILRKLCSLRLKEDGNLPDHLKEMTAMQNHLEMHDEGLKERSFMGLILSSLPPSYGSLINVIESRPKAELTLDYVKGKLRDEWRRRRDCTEDEQQHEKALKSFVSGSSKATDKKKKKKKVGACHNCGEDGHWQRDCPKPLKDKSGSAKANLAVERPAGMEMCLAVSGECSPNRWYLDSGATSHMTSDTSLLTNMDASKQPDICLADGTRIKSSGAGNGKLVSMTGSGVRMLVNLADVYHVPSLAGNLLSVSRICDLGYVVCFEKAGCKVMRGEEVVLVGERNGGLYRLKEFPERAMISKAEHPALCEHMWHRRLGHRDPDAVSKIVREDLGFGLKVQKCSVKCVCEVCLKGKMSRDSFPKESQSKSSAVGDLIHTDVGGPMEEATPSGNRFYVILVDDYSCYTVLYLLKKKSEVESKIREYCSLMKNQFGYYPKVIRSDGGGEYSSATLKNFLSESGILLQQTAPYSPQQNGKAERKNRYVVEMARCLLVESKLRKKYWGEAISTANYLQNRLPTSTVDKTPHELWHGKKPSYTHLRVFGSEAYVHVPKEKRRKLDAKAVKMTFVGYAEGRKAYRFLHPDGDWIVISRDAKFLESNGGEAVENSDDVIVDKPGPAAAKEPETFEVPIGGGGQANCVPAVAGPSAAPVGDEEQPEPEAYTSNAAESELETSVYENASEGELSFHGFPLDEVARRSNRSTKGVPAVRFDEAFVVAAIPTNGEAEPTSLQEALRCDQSAEWKSAMEEELQSHAENGTWELVPLPAGRKTVGCRWVYKVKRSAAGEAIKYKARLVAQGYCQKFGQDYDEVFAPVIKQTTLRMLLAIASKHNLQLRHFDVKTAYLNGVLQEELYMRQPAGFEEKGKEDLVCRLRRSIYGLKQSARCWNQRLHTVLKQLSFEQSTADPCLYVKVVNGMRIYLLVYVDDILVGCKSGDEIEEIYSLLRKEFKITDLGTANYFLGLEIKNIDGKYGISLEGYIDRIADRFGLSDAKGAKSPMDEGFTKAAVDSPPLENSTEYRSLVGALLYVAVCARPDVAVSASILGRSVTAPTQADMVAAKRVVRYLKATKSWQLRYDDPDGQLIAYSDADWAGDLKTRKSTTGSVFLYSGGAISWTSRLQQCVTLSSMESEFVALCDTSQEAVWLLHLMQDFGEPVEKPLTIMEDNQSCIKFVAAERTTRRSKHVETKQCYVKELCDKKELQLEYCPTEDMVADVLTKPVGTVKHRKLSSMMGLAALDGGR